MVSHPFSYDKIAAGSSIIGREAELAFIADLLEKGSRSLTLYGGPRSGKETLVAEALDRLKRHNSHVILCRIDLFNVRSVEAFVKLWRESMRTCAKEVNRNALLPFDIVIDDIPDHKLFDLPGIIAAESASPMVIWFKEFQNLLSAEGDNFKLDQLDKAWSRQKGVSYIFTGSCINAMKSIFDDRKLFYGISRPMELLPPDRRTVCEYIRQTFLQIGRVIEMEEVMALHEISGGNMWYVKQLCSFCYAMPAGYINRKIVNQARDQLLAIHVPRFKSVLFDLTVNQENLLHAVVDGVRKFTSSEMMERYRLNSSAGVARVKEALQKKEVITFDAEENARIIDPLFEYWLRYYYFI